MFVMKRPVVFCQSGITVHRPIGYHLMMITLDPGIGIITSAILHVKQKTPVTSVGKYVCITTICYPSQILFRIVKLVKRRCGRVSFVQKLFTTYQRGSYND